MQDNNYCSVCLEMNDNESIRLQCGHLIHSKCLHNYILHNFKNDIEFNTCPICRTYLSTNLQNILNIYKINRFNCGFVFGSLCLCINVLSILYFSS